MLLTLFPAAAWASDPQWTAPTAEELTMTAVPQAPAASAIYLYREENGDFLERATHIYVRIKVLNESAKDLANVELPFGGACETKYDNIAGRTIHSDGTIIPFTGKPFEKLIEKEQGHKYKEKIFSLPSVEVGSIIEYRYKRTFNYCGAPDWYVQTDLFTRKAHFSWKPGPGSSIAWTPILPVGAQVQVSKKGETQYTLDIENVAATPHDDMMPPLDSVSYRVLFYFTRFTSDQEFWKTNGEIWSTGLNEFIGPGKGVKAAVAGMVQPADTDDQKARKLYALLMTFENTDFTRQLTEREAKAQGIKDAESTDDILLRKRGSGNALTALFVAMARAAGLKAYVMRVADRSERLFLPGYLDLSQADDFVAIVTIAGKEVFFDPGQRYCPYAHLTWYHSMAGGLRQTATGTELATTPTGPFQENHIARIADLTVDDHGQASGTITLTYAGDPARRWRQVALLGDNTSLKADLRAEMEKLLPPGMEIEVTSIGDLTNPDVPLPVGFSVHGPLAAATGKRLLLPAFLFASSSKPLFPEAKREVPVDMRFGSFTQDAVRYKLPASITVESAPAREEAEIKGAALFESYAKPGQGSITLYRNVSMGRIIFGTSDYPQLRAFYQKMATRDQETLVLARGASSSSAD